ncbi:hypothetical protein [Saccharopolyspora sp. 6M]|uniref:hypothetical protein n=1 Tax=Saccharopolyspora sp. 6M TaxID=2877237 RepID=UPI001CD34781|nr:hypothetical protein [Saccharopolyspora sp. 6M]MCA1224670.1 hypothetical protein [Saccharopolyspora sp. 6M]
MIEHRADAAETSGWTPLERTIRTCYYCRQPYRAAVDATKCERIHEALAALARSNGDGRS